VFRTVVDPEKGVSSQAFIRSTPRPHLVEEFFDHMNTVDIHNHYRQGNLRLEHHWKTKKWQHRCIATLLGFCVVDAFFANRWRRRQADMEVLHAS
jgi:hypothetical protein